MDAPPVGSWWRAARAAWTFPRGTRRPAWRVARDLAPHAHGGFTRRFGEPLAERRCAVCSIDDVALDEWVVLRDALVCADCSHALLSGTLACDRTVTAFRGRAGSPRRALGEVYQEVVAFKERRGEWVARAAPLARALAASIAQLLPPTAPDAIGSRRPVLVPVPSYHGRRPHMRMLTALAAVRLSGVATARLDLLQKRRDVMQKGLTRAERRAEGEDAYRVRTAWPYALRGRHVIVTDDVVTTGATLQACARPLLRAGAAVVEGAAIVRIVRAPPERMLAWGARQIRVQLRELDGRGRTLLVPGGGSVWVLFACSLRCPATTTAGPFPIPTLDAVAYHRWRCRCGVSHLVRIRREWGGEAHQCLAITVGDRRPPELLAGIVQGPPALVS